MRLQFLTHPRARLSRAPTSLLRGAVLGAGLLTGCSSGTFTGGATGDSPSLPGDSIPGDTSAAGASANPANPTNPGNGGSGTVGTDPAAALDDPGLIGIRRLNRSEYNNTVRDLLGTTASPADDFPADDLLYGFDNIGEALSVSTLLFDGYDDAADKLVTELLSNPSGDAYKRVITCDVAAGGTPCLSQILQGFAERAWRRPVTEAELAPYLDLASQGATAAEGLQITLQTILISPNFMFRVELDPNPDSSTEAHPLSDFELASRMSYFLWGTMPDDTLFAAARGGTLQTDAALNAELERMLADTKAEAFVSDMAGMWLFGRAVGTATRDATLFPNWDNDLQQSMPEETRLFFEEFYKNDLPVNQMLTANFSFINERLAQHYQVPGITGSDFRRVDLSGNTERQGLLTQGTFLTVTSRSTRTSPVARGKWVLDQLMCSPPSPPPPGIDSNIDKPDFAGLTLRQRLELHEQQGSTCNACHAAMDPIGLGLENYDAIGSYRTVDGDGPIDASGQLPGNPPEPFTGPQELAQILANDSRFEHCLTQQLMTYGLGAKPATPWVDSVLSAATAGGAPTVKAMIRSLVRSNAFRMRRAGVKG